MFKNFLPTKLSSMVKSFNEIVEETIRRAIYGNDGMATALIALEQQSSLGKPRFSLKEMIENGFVWCPTPKHRTSAEKKLTKRFSKLPNSLMTKYATPKTNILTCLECGSFHERGSICGKCYAKVKTETSAIHDLMFKDDTFKYAYPSKEIGVKYENDPAQDEANSTKKIFVEVPKKRPEWFDSHLLPKVSTQK